MDSITQIVLGAAVGELIAGKKIGYKAVLWGAFAGTLPDLDIIAGLWQDPITYLSFHRGFSHSIFFAPIMAPLLAIIAIYIHKKELLPYRTWINLFFWSLLTHPLLDLFTGYGTQLLNPISNYGFEINSIFIIDPLYTIPFLICLIVGLRKSNSDIERTIWVKRGIYISSLYLILSLGLKYYGHTIIKNQAKDQGIVIHRMMSIPGPFTSFLWRGLIETEEAFYQVYYSVFDDPSKELIFYKIPKSNVGLELFESSRALDTLIWFSKGFYTVESVENSNLAYAENVYFNDLRFGTLGGWDGNYNDHVFKFEIYKNEVGEISFRQAPITTPINSNDFITLLKKSFSLEK